MSYKVSIKRNRGSTSTSTFTEDITRWRAQIFLPNNKVWVSVCGFTARGTAKRAQRWIKQEKKYLEKQERIRQLEYEFEVE